MSDVSGYTYEELKTAPQAVGVFDEPPFPQARIEATINGKKYAAIVPLSWADDRPAMESYLRHIAEDD